MYFVEFFKKLFRKSNIPIIIYMAGNVLITALVLKLIDAVIGSTTEATTLGMQVKPAVEFAKFLGIALVVYLVSIVLVLSPIGEAIIRRTSNSKKTGSNDVKNYFQPIFNAVYERARTVDPTLPENIEKEGIDWYIKDDDSANAYALGRKTICITKGLLQLPVEEVNAILGHEFGHIANGDTDNLLVVTTGNFLITAISYIATAFVTVFTLFSGFCTTLLEGISSAGGEGGFAAKCFALLGRFLSRVVITFFSTIIIKGLFGGWSKLGLWMVRKSVRDNEFGADEFAFNCGYGDSLCRILGNDTQTTPEEGLFVILEKTHPSSAERIEKLRDLGANYTMTFGGGQTNTINITSEPKETTALGGYYTPAAFVSTQVEPAKMTAIASRCSCGAELRAQDKFCPSCGKKVECEAGVRLCPHCKAEVEELDSKFCVYCGQKL